MSQSQICVLFGIPARVPAPTIGDYCTLIDAQELFKDIVEISTLAVLGIGGLFARNQLREAKNFREVTALAAEHTRDLTKINTMREIDTRLNSRYFSEIYEFLQKNKEEFVDRIASISPGGDWRVTISKSPQLRMEYAGRAHILLKLSPQKFFPLISLCRLIDFVALLNQEDIVSDDEVKALLGGVLTQFGPFIPDMLNWQMIKDPDGFGFADRVLRLFRLMPINESVFSTSFPIEIPSDSDIARARTEQFWISLLERH